MREYLLDKKQEKLWKVKNADMAFLRKNKTKTNPFYQFNSLGAHIMHSPTQHITQMFCPSKIW